MSEVVYHVRPKAAEAIAKKRLELLDLRMRGVISSAQVREMMAECEARVLREDGAHGEADPDRNVFVECPDCNTRHVMAASVERYQCKCTPHIHRLATVGRISPDQLARESARSKILAP